MKNILNVNKWRRTRSTNYVGFSEEDKNKKETIKVTLPKKIDGYTFQQYNIHEYGFEHGFEEGVDSKSEVMEEKPNLHKNCLRI